MNQHVRLVDGEEIEIPAFTRDVAGLPIDLRTLKWRMNVVSSNHSLINWGKLRGCDEEATSALRIHIVRHIETKSTNYTHSAFWAIAEFLRTLRDDASAPTKSVTISSLMWYLERLRKKKRGWQFHHIRLWYTASADRLLDGFDDEVVFAIEDPTPTVYVRKQDGSPWDGGARIGGIA